MKLVTAVFLAALVLLSWNAAKPGIATAYVDPVAKIQAQDEAYYASISLEMARSGDWLTPRFLDRYALTKPPLLYWFEVLAAKIGGRSALRAPSVLAGAATIAIVFWWLLGEGAPLAAALSAVVLLLGSHLFFVVSRIVLTDALLTLEMSVAMLVLSRDPRLAARWALWTFGIASGAAILTKGIAGLFPLMVVALFCVISKERPGWQRLIQAVGITALVAAPWHIYQLWRHTRWFWSEYVLTEILGYSAGSPAQTTRESHAGYYAKRLLLMDGALLAAALLALVRKRPRVIVAWVIVVLAAMMANQYRNTTYLLPLLPACALLVGEAIPARWSGWVLSLSVLLAIGKIMMPAQVWGLPFGAQSMIPAEAALDRYAALKRGNELIIGSPNDGFYSATLDLPHVRYLYLDPRTQREHDALNFEYLGVTVTAPDFDRLPEVRPVFRQRLQEWGLNQGDPLATVILAQNMDQAGMTIRDHPYADFLLPESWAERDGGVHEALDAGGGLDLLLSREKIQWP